MLNIVLPQYTCSSCETHISQFEVTRHSIVYERLVLDLISVLRCWQSISPLTLELNPYCPSDSELWF